MKRVLFFGASILFVVLFFAACGGDDVKNGGTETPAKVSNVKAMSFNLIAEYPHDTASFTEGLEFYKIGRASCRERV